MWWPDRVRGRLSVAALAAAALAASCTAQPLYSSSVAPAAATAEPAGSVAAALASVNVDPVSTREAQQVRNEMIFLMSRGRGNPDGAAYTLGLSAYAFAQNSAVTILTNTEQAPSSQVMVFVGRYTLRDAATGKVVAQGERRASAAFDNPQQPFAAARAARDAQNRSARELAALLVASIGADLATGRTAAGAPAE